MTVGELKSFLSDYEDDILIGIEDRGDMWSGIFAAAPPEPRTLFGPPNPYGQYDATPNIVCA